MAPRRSQAWRAAALALCLATLLVAGAGGALAADEPAAGAPEADADSFAQLSVIAYGAQRFDLATGFTELSDGGEVIDRGTGVRLAAPWLRYAEGDRLEASDALVHGAFGELTAAKLTLDMARRELRAEGGVRLVTPHGAVSAQTLAFDADGGWVLVRGDIRSEDVDLTAAAVWFEVAGGRLVLLPPYLYVDGPVTLQADGDGAPLQLTPELHDDGTLAGFDATTRLDDDVRLHVLPASGE
jgi:hypothetical protein